MYVADNKALNDFLVRLSYGSPYPLRTALATELAASTRLKFAAAASADLSDAAEAAARLRTEGVLDLGQVLDARQVAEARDALVRAPVHAGHKFTVASQPYPFEILRGRVHYASYAPSAVLAAPHLIELANDPRLLRIAESYLGCPPTLYSVNAWWSFAQGTPASMSQAWHRDRDDFRFVTLFVYLTPVTSLNGPHRYARFSHDQPALTEQLVRLGMPAAEAQAAVDPQFWGTGYQHAEQTEATLGDFVHTWLGAAGTAILADTYGLHMGKPPQQGERLMFWARYGLGANAGSVTRDEMAGGVDLAARLGSAPRTRYVNRLLSGDATILDEIAPDPEPADPLSM